MKLRKFTDKDGRQVEINPDAVSYIYSSGGHTAIVFGAQHANPLMIPLSRDIVHRRLLGLDTHAT